VGREGGGDWKEVMAGRGRGGWGEEGGAGEDREGGRRWRREDCGRSGPPSGRPSKGASFSFFGEEKLFSGIPRKSRGGVKFRVGLFRLIEKGRKCRKKSDV